MDYILLHGGASFLNKSISVPALIPIPEPGAPVYQAAEFIYEQSFGPEEKLAFYDLWRWLSAPGENYRPVLLAAIEGEQVLGMGSMVYWPEVNLAYWAYIAIHPERRGLGYGELICRSLLSACKGLAQAERKELPRLVFWEVRDPREPADETEQATRQQRMQFYRRLGSFDLPIEYTAPPIADGFPPVRYRLMVRTFPSSRPVNRQDALDVAWAGLVTINAAAPESDTVQAALSSVHRYWPHPDSKLGRKDRESGWN